MNIKACSLFILIFFIFTIESKENSVLLHRYAQRNWRTVTGLTHDNVTSVYRDSEGFVWVGTIEGLTRLDGYAAKNFSTRTHPDLLSNRIVSVKGNDQAVFAATAVGLSKITGGVKVSKIIEENDITGLAVLDNGIVYVSKSDEIIQINGQDIKKINILNGLPEGKITSIFSSKDDLFIGNELGGIYSFSKEKFSSNLCEINSKEITSGDITENEKIVFGNIAGEVFEIEDSICKALLSEEIFDKSPVVSVSAKRESIRAAYKNVVLMIEKNKIRSYKNCCNLPGNISDILYDNDEFLWIAGDRGLSLYYQATFVTLGKDDGLSSEMVYAMVEDNAGRVWVGTRGGGLFYMSDDKFIQVPDNAGIPSQFVGGMMIDAKGDLWVGTSKGIVTFSPVFPLKTKKVNSVRKGEIPLASVLFQDNSGRIWAGTADGHIYMLVKEGFTLVKKIGESKSDFISGITQDIKGRIWFGTSQGLLVLEKDSFRTVSTQQGLPDNLILSIFADKKGSLFAGTARKGLVVIKSDGIVLSLSSSKGLCSDTIFSILEDNKENLWFTSTQGIFKISKDLIFETLNPSSSKTLNCHPFDSQDGIKRPECTGGVQPSSMKRKNGQLWFPTVEGAVFTGKTLTAQVNPNVLIDSVVADGIEKDLSDALKIKGTVSLLELKFVAGRFVHPERLNVRYRLHPHEESWNDYFPLEKTTVVYQKVFPGNYMFEVEATGENGEKIVRKLEVIIEDNSLIGKFKYEMIFFFMITASVIMFMVFKYLRSRKRKNLKVVKSENIQSKSVEAIAENDYFENSDEMDDLSDDYSSFNENMKDEELKYEKSRLDESIAKSYALELKQLMETKKPYKNPDLTLPELAKKLGLTTNILSQVINGYCGQNFYTFINIYRTEEVISMMKDSAQKEKSLLDLAYEAGFKSKTTFNTIFKKHTGLTPSEFKKSKIQ